MKERGYERFYVFFFIVYIYLLFTLCPFWFFQFVFLIIIIMLCLLGSWGIMVWCTAQHTQDWRKLVLWHLNGTHSRRILVRRV